MNILGLSREQIEELTKKGWMNKKAVNHFDVCKALAEGKSQSEIAEKFNYSETVHIRWIKSHKCPECK